MFNWDITWFLQYFLRELFKPENKNLLDILKEKSGVKSLKNCEKCCFPKADKIINFIISTQDTTLGEFTYLEKFSLVHQTWFMKGFSFCDYVVIKKNIDQNLPYDIEPKKKHFKLSLNKHGFVENLCSPLQQKGDPVLLKSQSEKINQSKKEKY